MKNKLKRFFWITVLASVAVAICYGLLVTNNKVKEFVEEPVTLLATPVEAAEIVDWEKKYTGKIEQLKDEVLNKIHAAESNVLLKEGEVFYVNDPNSKMREACLRVGGKRPLSCDSWGPWQMKIEFIQRRHMELYAKPITEKDAILLALDNDKARAFASDCIFNLEGCVWEWSTSAKHVEFLKTMIPLVREMEN